MQKLSNVNKGDRVFMYNNKTMPFEFAEICKMDKFQNDISKRAENPWRNYVEFNKFLKKDYKGELPKSLLELAKKFKKPDYICDLFYLNEDGYKNMYPEEYANFFENKPQREKEKIFQATDYGARTLFEFKQDVIAGNLLEDMITYHTKGILSPNEKASGRGSDILTTSCDFIFRSPDGSIEQPVELKTKWNYKLKDKEYVQMRGTIDTILKEKGMVLAIYIKMNKAILVDPIGKHYNMSPGKTKSGKDCVNIEIDKSDIVDFMFWDKGDLSKMMHMILDQYNSRETK